MSHASAATPPHHGHGHAAGGHHITSMPMLIGVFAALICLSIITVLVASIDFGEFNLFVAMGIATVKATLVALFFMHLAYDRGFNTLAFFGSFLFVTLFVGITLMDSGQYQSQVEWKETVLAKEPEPG
jgi:cytochrome c oxidase subunit 4